MNIHQEQSLGLRLECLPSLSPPFFGYTESVVISAHAGWWEDPSWEICLNDILMTLGTRVKISCNNTGHFQSVVALHMQHCRIHSFCYLEKVAGIGDGNLVLHGRSVWALHREEVLGNAQKGNCQVVWTKLFCRG